LGSRGAVLETSDGVSWRSVSLPEPFEGIDVVAVPNQIWFWPWCYSDGTATRGRARHDVSAYNLDVERVYLDMCSLKRPFDDQRQPRVREEAAAVAQIMARAEAGEIALVRSVAHRVENDVNPREDRRTAAALWIDGAAVDAPLTATVESRAAELHGLGFSPLDALHVAFAEEAGARWFVTCDDQLVKLADRTGSALRTRVVTPPEVPKEKP
jgi:predicted nucleic acid-binding protein